MSNLLYPRSLTVNLAILVPDFRKKKYHPFAEDSRIGDKEEND
jgi:hypothetical protein